MFKNYLEFQPLSLPWCSLTIMSFKNLLWRCIVLDGHRAERPNGNICPCRSARQTNLAPSKDIEVWDRSRSLSRCEPLVIIKLILFTTYLYDNMSLNYAKILLQIVATVRSRTKALRNVLCVLSYRDSVNRNLAALHIRRWNPLGVMNLGKAIQNQLTSSTKELTVLTPYRKYPLLKYLVLPS